LLLSEALLTIAIQIMTDCHRKLRGPTRNGFKHFTCGSNSISADLFNLYIYLTDDLTKMNFKIFKLSCACPKTLWF